jgi:hypothetical protein
LGLSPAGAGSNEASIIVGVAVVFGAKRHREDRRYYLLPGMGRSNKRRHWQILRWALVIGAGVSAIFGYVLYWVNRP